MSQEKKSFWQSAPGTVAAVAAMVTALAGAVPVIMAIRGGGDSRPTGANPTPSATSTAPTEASPSPDASPDASPDDQGTPGGTDAGAAPPVIASPKSVDFGKVAPGLSSSTQPLQLVNAGQDPVTVERVRIVGPDAESFKIVEGTCTEGTELAPDTPCDLKIRFAPSRSSSQNATLVVDRSPGDPIQVTLSGTGSLL